MKTHLSTFVFLACSAAGGAQAPWQKQTDPADAISAYTTNYPYVGASFVDFNQDGWLDLFVAPNRLYRNNGAGKFQPHPSLSFSPMVAIAGASWADIDNDGDLDCAVACTPSRLFLNNGPGIFTNATAQAPGLTTYGSWAAALGDFNEDNRLDLVFAHADGYHPGSTPSPCKLYGQQDPPFGFQAVGGYPFTTGLSSYTNPFWSDYDLDGDLDLFIASGPVTQPGFDPCFKNLKMETGLDTLAAMTGELFATQLQDGQCYNFIDFDNDRDLDLCLANFVSAPTRFYRNDGGIYTELATPFSNTAANLSNCWGDYDNDGDLDVIFSNDNTPCRYYRNNGNGAFSYLPAGFTTPGSVSGIVNGDFDNDGDLDVFANGVGSAGTPASVGLYLNQTVAGDRHWVSFRLEGVASNRSAVGALVSVRAQVNGQTTWQMREVSAQNSFQGQNDLRVHFGLSEAQLVDSVEIRWPSGAVQYFTDLPANTFYTLTEGEDQPAVPAPDVQAGAAGIRIFPNPVGRGMLHLVSPEPMRSISVWDMQGRRLAQRDFPAEGPYAYEFDPAGLLPGGGLLYVGVGTSKGLYRQPILYLSP